MSGGLNHCTFIGRLGQTPETKYLPSGDAVTNISIAVSRSWKDKTSGERKEHTTWVPVVAFKKLAEIMAQYLTKGSQVYIAGEFTVRKWQDKEGKDRYSTEIVASEMLMLSSKPAGEGAAPSNERTTASHSRAPATQQAPVTTEAPFQDDDIPF